MQISYIVYRAVSSGGSSVPAGWETVRNKLFDIHLVQKFNIVSF